MHENWQSRKSSLFCILISLLLLIVVGCGASDQNLGNVTGSAAADSTTSSTEGVPGMDNVTNEHLTRVLSLLAPSATGISLTEAELIAPLEAIGALEGVGFLAPNPNVAFSVYAFATQAEHAAAFDVLRSTVQAQNAEPLIGSNGAALFFGYVVNDGSGDPIDAETKLGTLAAAFAGEE